MTSESLNTDEKEEIQSTLSEKYKNHAIWLSKKDVKIGILLDCGKTSPYLFDGFRNLDILIIEANHSFDELLHSSYSDLLKERILSANGHLSNWHTAEFIIETKPKIAVITHISENNNNPETAYCEIESKVASESVNYKPFYVLVPSKGRGALISYSDE